MDVPAGPGLGRGAPQAPDRPTASSRTSSWPSIPQLETVERLVRRGHYNGPLNLTWVAIGGGFDGPNPYNMMNFIRRVPDGADADAGDADAQRPAGQHDGHRHGPARPLRQRGHPLGPQGREDAPPLQQIEQLVRIASELGREIATGKEARDIYRIGETYGRVDETLAKLGYAPNRKPGQLGFTFHA